MTAGLFAIGMIIAFFTGAVCARRCECCERYGCAWRAPTDDEPQDSSVCDRCGVCSSELAA